MKKIGLITAMAKELKVFLQKLGKEKEKIESKGFCVYRFEIDGEKELFVTDSGVGEVSSAIATQMLVDRFGVEMVMNFGVCGSLDNSLDVADIVFGESVYHFDRDTSALDGVEVGYYTEYGAKYLKADEETLLQAKKIAPEIRAVRIASSEKFVASSKLKAELQKEGASVCEMEALGVLLTAKRNNLPFLLIKAVSDKADEEAKMSFNEMLSLAMQKCSDLISILINNF